LHVACCKVLLTGFKDEGITAEIALAKLKEQWPVTYIEPQCTFQAALGPLLPAARVLQRERMCATCNIHMQHVACCVLQRERKHSTFNIQQSTADATSRANERTHVHR
jgi:hypothetical protein